jgi:WhiB family redox-sensing transcriptional regulator
VSGATTTWTTTVGAGWMAEAACRELPTAVFFPEDQAGVAVACLVCGACTVRDLCLEYALTNRIAQGVWGGASESERRKMRSEPAVGL